MRTFAEQAARETDRPGGVVCALYWVVCGHSRTGLSALSCAAVDVTSNRFFT